MIQNGELELSETASQFMAGILKHAPALQLLQTQL